MEGYFSVPTFGGPDEVENTAVEELKNPLLDLDTKEVLEIPEAVDLTGSLVRETASSFDKKRVEPDVGVRSILTSGIPEKQEAEVVRSRSFLEGAGMIIRWSVADLGKKNGNPWNGPEFKRIEVIYQDSGGGLLRTVGGTLGRSIQDFSSFVYTKEDGSVEYLCIIISLVTNFYIYYCKQICSSCHSY